MNIKKSLLIVSGVCAILIALTIGSLQLNNSVCVGHSIPMVACVGGGIFGSDDMDEKRLGIIYLVTNVVDGKRYVGKTIRTLQIRKAEHKKHSRRGADTFFHKAIRKHGFDAFNWRILLMNDDPDELSDAEQFCIKKFKTRAPKGYNLTAGGEGIVGLVHSEKTKRKISESHKGIKLSVDHKRRISEAGMGRVSSRRGIPLSLKTKQKISELTRGEKNASARLTEREVLEIYRKADRGELHRKIAAEYKIAETTVYNIYARRTWKYLTEQEPRRTTPLPKKVLTVEQRTRMSKSQLGLSRGEKNASAKLTEEDVYAVRRLIVSGEKQRVIADDYGVTYQTIYAIKTRRTWKYLPEQDKKEN